MDIQSKATGSYVINAGPGFGQIMDSFSSIFRLVDFPIYTGDIPLQLSVTGVKRDQYALGRITITGVLVNHPDRPEISLEYSLAIPSECTGSVSLNPGEYEKLTPVR